MKPKVLVGCPISSLKLYCFEEFIHALGFMSYPNYEILLVETDGDEEMQTIIRNMKVKCDTINVPEIKMMDKVVNAREYIRQYAIDNKFDYVLNLDADIIVKENTIEQLLNHKKDYVSAVAFGMDQYGGPELVARDFNYCPVSVDNLGTGLKEVTINGMGCVLVSTELMKQIKFRCERDEEGNILTSEDYCYSNDARGLGYKIYLDTDIQVKHLMQGNWPVGEI